MGEVHKAKDTRLDRTVAIKVLPDAFAQDPERVARFEREAKTLASLNHPNIAIIHGLEKSQGTYALVMELVEGEDLSQRIARGPIPIDEAFPIARQIAEALEAAHEQGIIHRDLKPANIKVRPDGTVKVLDFGLAKLTEPASGSHVSAANASMSPTITSPALMSGVGVLLGTAAYMSPEQAKGRPADKRSDIWAFGCVLYEMLTAHRAFGGEDITETIAAVVKSEPEWDALPSAMSPILPVFLRRCLHKDSKQRVGDIRDVRLALEGAFDVKGATPVVISESRRHVWQRPPVAAMFGAGLMATTGLAIWTFTRSPEAPPTRLTVSLPAGITIAPSNSDPDVTISPDGRRIAFVGASQGKSPQLYTRTLDQLDAQPLAGPASPRTPFFSPDGNWIGFFDTDPNVLKKISVNGGPALTLCAIAGAAGAAGGGVRGASWGADNSIVFATNDPTTGLLRVSAGGGTPEVLTKPNQQNGEADHFWPEVLPGGKAILFTIVMSGGSPAATARALDKAQIAVLDLRTGQQKVLVRGGSHPHYVSTGHIVYGLDGTLRAVAFDLNRLEVKSDPGPVLEGVVTKQSGAASYGVAQDGSLVYVEGKGQDVTGRSTLVWVNRQGSEEPINAPVRSYNYPRISPDGTKVAFDIRDQDFDIWIWDFLRSTLTRLTFDPGVESYPVWSPDGRRVAFASEAKGSAAVYWRPADGTGVSEQIATSPDALLPHTFSPDGSRLVVRRQRAPGADDLFLVTLTGERRMQPLFQTAFFEGNAEISPDARWLAYQSNESGRSEIYVRPFPEVDAGRWQVSSGGGSRPLWARNGQELFYVSPDGAIMRVGVERGASWTATIPAQAVKPGYFVAGGVNSPAGRSYDIAPDANRFLMIKEIAPDQTAASGRIVVVQRFDQELKRLVPTK